MFHRPKTEEQKPEETAKQQDVAVDSEKLVEEQMDFVQEQTTPVEEQTVSETETEEEAIAETVTERPSTSTPLSKWTNPNTQRPIIEEKSMSNEQDSNRNIDIPGSQFSRPSQPASFVGGAYPGSTSPSSTSAAEADGRRLVISEGITMSGEISACDYLVIEGTVEAALQGARVLEVTESGTFYGAVQIEEATIAGRFEGEIVVNGRLTIKSGGVVTGTISYKELQVEAGAEIDGKISPLASTGSSQKSSSKEGAKKAAPAKNDNKQRKGELPLDGTEEAAVAAE